MSDTSLNDILLLKVNWAVPSRPIIINLNVLEDRLAHLISGHDWFVLDRFNLHRMEKALNTRIIPAVFFSTHTLL